MKYLAICIPNYNRIEKLQRLIENVARQIMEAGAEREVEICISDDCSPENPENVIKLMQFKYPQVSISYERNTRNMGMDYNFRQSVLIADSKYCWIIGNDDLPTESGIEIVVNHLKKGKDITDILVTPFDVYGEDEGVRETIYPLGNNIDKKIVYHTGIAEQYNELIMQIHHNSAIFGFLSNIIFKRENWVKYKEKFQDKLDTIFIQMYMNIQTLQDGAVYEYLPKKIIKNYADDKTNESSERICRILVGLDGVVEYFFDGSNKEHMKKILTDTYINATAWELPPESPYKDTIIKIESVKNRLYHKYYIAKAERKNFFEGEKVIIYGAGKYGSQAFEELKSYNIEIIGVADSDMAKTGMDFMGLKIQAISEMVRLYYEEKPYIIVANHFYLEEMVEVLQRQKVEKIAIIN